MKKLVERFILLNQFGERLLHRLYHTKKKWTHSHTRNQFLLFSDRNVNKIAEIASKRFPSGLPDIEKVSGHEDFVNGSPELLFKTRPMYQLTMDILDWKSNAHATFLQASEAFPLGLDMETQPFLLNSFLRLVSLYCKVMIMLSEVPDRRLFLATHFASFVFADERNNECEYDKEAPPTHAAEIDHLITFYSEPAKRLYEDFTPEKAPQFLQMVFSTISKLQLTLETFHSVSELRRLSGISLTQDQDKLSLPALTEPSINFPSLINFRDGVVFSTIIAPEAFKEKEGVPLKLLSLVLRHNSSIRMVREDMFQAHNQIGSLFGRFKDSSGNQCLKRHRKHIQSTLSESVTGVGLTHRRQLHLFLIEELRSLVIILTDFPALVGPKLPILLGALSLARDAVVQHYEHTHNAPSGSRMKKGEGVGGVLVLIHWAVELGRIVEKNKKEAREYYGEYLKGQHANSFKKHTDAARNQLSEIEQRIVQAIVKQLQAIDLSAPSSGSSSPSSYSLSAPSPALRALRLNWQRLELSLSSSGKASQLPRVMDRGRWLALHSRYWDEWTEVIKETTSFSLLWSYSKQVISDFGHTFRTPGLTACALSAFTLLDQFPGIATVERPDEKSAIAKFVVENAEQRCDELSYSAFQMIQEVWEQFGEWDDQTEPIGTGTALLASLPEGPKIDRKPPAPVGSESAYSSRGALKGVEAKQIALIELLRAFQANPSLVVFDFEFSPREYFRKVLKQQWRDVVVRLGMVGGEGEGRGTPVQISRVERAIKLLHYTLSLVESYVSLALRDVFEEVWKETTAVGLVHPPPDPNNPLSWVTNEPLHFPANCFIRTYAKFYLDMVTHLANQVSYSPKYNAFVKKPGSSVAQVENLTSIGELRALCRLVGPIGFRCIHHGLLLEAAKKLGEVLSFCENNAQTLEALVDDVQRMKNDRDHDNLVKSLKGQGALMQACLTLGMLLQMRELLREAQKSVVEDKAPHVLRAVDSVYKLYNSNLFLEKSFLPLDCFAADCGLEVKGGADQALIYLTKGLFPSSKGHLVRLLPVAFALLFHHGIWSESSFISHLGGYVNNLHVMGLGMSQAITSLGAALGNSEDEVLEVPKLLEGYLESATNVLFALAGGGPNKDSIFANWLDDSSEKNRSFPHMVFFLDFFLESTCYVTRESLEKLIPYALLRSMRQAVTQKNSQGNFF